jgi:hypothetical protein
VIVVRETNIPIIGLVPKIRPRSVARGASNYCVGTCQLQSLGVRGVLVNHIIKSKELNWGAEVYEIQGG